MLLKTNSHTFVSLSKIVIFQILFLDLLSHNMQSFLPLKHFAFFIDFCHCSVFMQTVSDNHTAVCPPLVTPHLCWAASDGKFFFSHFLFLDLPKIALTGDINGLLLASFWLLQIFWKHETQGKSEREGREGEKKKEYGSPPPTTSHRRSPLSLIACPNLFPP